MIKYSFKHQAAIENYWGYCCELQIPHIEITIIDEEYVNISFDLLPCLPADRLKGDLPDCMLKIYDAYSHFYRLPPDRFSFIGGSNALGATVLSRHAEPVSEQLFDFLLDYVRKNKYPSTNVQL
jgi:hypothetical protein